MTDRQGLLTLWDSKHTDWAGLQGEWPGITVRTLETFIGDKVTGDESTNVGVPPLKHTAGGSPSIKSHAEVAINQTTGRSRNFSG
ncbi:hypothetical protein MTR_7g076882 [Medicago truncatula]|uniref:Uncharacterized protein n=1 Tax=Medicago truncatula TaxID=3880 RepID=A0A072U121_MEDTR|nr:hypothetical protein MTR_7g076882 [Medicago truncatula]